MPSKLLVAMFASALLLSPFTQSNGGQIPSDRPGLLPAQQLMSETRPLVIGHRGYPVLAPENTLPSFEFAAVGGADLVELDYHHSKDGIPVVIHDYEVDRTTDGDEKWLAKKIRVDAKTAQELQTLDAGKWFKANFTGTRVPLLTEAIAAIQKHSVTLIERKAGDAGTCVKLLRERDLINRVIVQAFDWTYLKEFHEQEPRQILAALGPPASHDGVKLSESEKALSSRWIDEAKKAGVQVIAWSRQVSKSAIDEAHGKGLKVWVYTINEPGLANQLLDNGVDGLITDNTSLIWRTLALRPHK
jgi:glycerophosphoryl diester phosphodiesterase